MASLIPQSFIDTLLDRVDIVELVDSRVKLKKSGKNYSACCPFHDEKTPSFTVTQDKQFYYCFGCGASGNAIGFMMDYERSSFPEAVELLARLSGLEVPRDAAANSPEQIARDKERRSMYELLESAADFYKIQLRQHPARTKAVGYLQNRGLSGEIARDFGIGLAPPGWDHLLQALGETVEDQRLLIESGMLVNRDDSHKLYDRFRDRIMFPIRDVRGRVIGFGGRVLDDSKPKYLNSPESPVFHKGEELYGLHEARKANSSLTRLLVVEGYMDVIALAQFDIRYAVATLGTACREDHLTKAFKYTQEIVFCFDGDDAGRTAAKRALESSLPVMTDGRQVKFLFLPEKEDPDTLVRQIGAGKFTGLIEHALPLEDFFFDVISENIDIRSMEGRARVSKLAAPLLDKLPAGVYRQLMFKQLAKRTGLDQETLSELIDQVPVQTLAPKEVPAENLTADDDTTPPEDYDTFYETEAEPVQRQIKKFNAQQIKLPAHRLASLLLLHHPELAKSVESTEEIEAMENQDLELLVSLLKLLKQRPHFTTGQILGHIQGSMGSEGAQPLTALSEQLGELILRVKQVPNYNPEMEFNDALKRIMTNRDRQQNFDILEKLKSKPFAELNDEEKQLYKETLAKHSSLH